MGVSDFRQVITFATDQAGKTCANFCSGIQLRMYFEILGEVEEVKENIMVHDKG